MCQQVEGKNIVKYNKEKAYKPYSDCHQLSAPQIVSGEFRLRGQRCPVHHQADFCLYGFAGIRCWPCNHPGAV